MIRTPAKTNLPVMLPYDPTGRVAADPIMFSRWLASMPIWVLPMMAACLVLWPAIAHAASNYSYGQATSALFKWMPFIVLDGFLLNVVISLFTMIFGTFFGVLLGLGQISPAGWIRIPAKIFTQVFRNSPWLVLLFVVLLALPFEITIGGVIISIPDWTKAVFGLSLPVMANISEVVRGAINSVPSGQWEAAESLAYSRRQTLWLIILPQCFKRMIPPWMNWYAILTMATPLCSLLGVEEIITLSRQAIEAEDNHPELLVPFFGFALLIFFAYCYPIARWTVRLERRFQVKL
ncbi:amino acid ABC transporter permease [Falsiphaeobacter marinintestinus]|uniref:amino acid ABC transporter permease n=1 Tax=Falsiphaeobacter marinintestinus TaxID=1492905 RepID=UPI0011B7101E|nr:amino acid ABC transporter permease [Phaeobacter marinintestinus]